MLFGKRRNRNERNPEAELIKAGALIWKWAGRVSGKSGAKGFFRVQADRAVRAAAQLGAGGRVGKIGALSHSDSVGSARATLRRTRRFHMVVRSAVLVVGNQDDRVLPVGTVAHCINHLRDEGLASLDVRWRMLIVLGLVAAEEAEIGIDKRHLREWAGSRHTRSLGQ